jgi:phospholipase/carboxylesterase
LVGLALRERIPLAEREAYGDAFLYSDAGMPLTDHTLLQFRPAEGFYTSQVEAPHPWPVRTFLPIGYEPRYPYPLLVFLHGHGGNEEQVLRLAPRLSRRNFIAIGLRGPVALDANDDRPNDGLPSYAWGDGRYATLLEDYLLRAVEQTRRRYHVHSERVYLAGLAEGATVAYRLGLTFADRLGGVIALNGAMPRLERPLLRLPHARSLRVFIGHGIANLHTPWTHARHDLRVLSAAGLSVTMHSYPTTHKLHPDMLRDVNRWIIDHCHAAAG